MDRGPVNRTQFVSALYIWQSYCFYFKIYVRIVFASSYHRVLLPENLIAKSLAILSIHLPRQGDFFHYRTLLCPLVLQKNYPQASTTVSSLDQQTDLGTNTNLVMSTHGTWLEKCIFTTSLNYFLSSTAIES